TGVDSQRVAITSLDHFARRILAVLVGATDAERSSGHCFLHYLDTSKSRLFRLIRAAYFLRRTLIDDDADGATIQEIEEEGASSLIRRSISRNCSTLDSTYGRNEDAERLDCVFHDSSPSGKGIQ